MANKRVNDLPAETDPASDDVVLIDGATTRKTSRANLLKENLEAIRGLTSAADKGIQFTGSGTAATYDLTTAGKALLDDADAAAQRTTLGLVIGTDVQAYDADLDDWAGKAAPTGTVVGTTDTQTLTNKTLTAPSITSPTGIVKGDVGLGNVDNTSDADKPVSTATQTALDLKADISSLGTAAAADTTDFATAAQGSTADSAVQPSDLGDLAVKNTVAVSDIDATGTASSSTYLRGDGAWGTPAGGGGGDPFYVADRTALKALDTSSITSAYVAEGDRAGIFNWLTGDFSSEVTADTTEALYVESSGTASSSGAWVRGALGELNILWGGADPTGTADSAAVINVLKTLGPLYAPAGSYKLTAKIGLVTGFKLRGDGIDQTIFITSGVDSFGPAAGSTDYTNIELRDFTVKQASSWGSNTLTAIDFSNVSYSRVERVKAMYHQYGVFMRRSSSSLQCYFNTFSEVWVFGSQYYFSLQDTGDTPNKITFIDCRAEDNGQRSSGYGMDLCGWGHTVVGFYAGLPGHTAALRLQSGCGGLSAIGIYGESSTLTQVVLDATTGNPNTVNGVHADGTSIGVTKSNASCRTMYINAGAATNVFGEVVVTASKTPPAVGTGSYDYTSFTVTGIAVGDTAKIIVPTAWPAGLVRGEPIVESGTVRLPYVNNSGGSLTPPSGTYTVAWQDRTP